MQISALINAFSARRSALLGALSTAFATLLFAALPQAASAGAFLPDSAQSPNASDVRLVYIFLFIFGVLTILGVIAALVRATRSPAAADGPAAGREASVAGGMTMGFVVAAFFAAVGCVFYANNVGADPSSSGVGSSFKPTPYQDNQLRTPNNVKPPTGPSMTVHINGQQYLWRYQYDGFPGKPYSYHLMVVPTGVTVLLDVTSSDVEHAWWVPQLGGSIDALPGYINKGWIRVDKPGVYTGSGTRLNGTNYASQTTTVVAVPPKQFLLWVKGKSVEINAAMAALAAERASGQEAQLITGRGPAGAASAAATATGGVK